MILVTGAAGKTGNAVVKALAAKGASVRALVRRTEQVATLKSLGAAEVNVGSFDDPAALQRATDGVRALYHICPNVSREELRYATSLADAAEANKVERFVFHSVLHPQIEAMPHHWRKMRAEEMLFTRSFALTVLQPTAYMQNLLGAWRGITEDGLFRVPYPAATRISLVDLDDVAEVAAIVLTQSGYDGAVYELAGTPPLSQTEVAATLSASLRKNIRVDVESVEAWETRMRLAHMGDHERETLAAMFRYYAAHGLIGNANTLRWLLGRAPNDLAHFIGRVLKPAE
jgi:NAD(P)H dehydrogenase (quinone)